MTLIQTITLTATMTQAIALIINYYTMNTCQYKAFMRTTSLTYICKLILIKSIVHVCSDGRMTTKIISIFMQMVIYPPNPIVFLVFLKEPEMLLNLINTLLLIFLWGNECWPFDYLTCLFLKITLNILTTI